MKTRTQAGVGGRTMTMAACKTREVTIENPTNGSTTDITIDECYQGFTSIETYSTTIRGAHTTPRRFDDQAESWDAATKIIEKKIARKVKQGWVVTKDATTEAETEIPRSILKEMATAKQ